MKLEENSIITMLFASGFLIAGGITDIIGNMTSCYIAQCLAFGFCIAGLFNAIIAIVQMTIHMR